MNAELLTRLRRDKNRLKWGEQNWPDGTKATHQATLNRNNAQMLVDCGMKKGSVTYLEILLEEVFEAACEEDPHKLVAELIDVAAVAQDWADSIMRRQCRSTAENETRAAAVH